MTTPLTPVQQRALQLSRGKPGFAYFLEMGLGKTLLALTEFLGHARGDQLVTRLVVVCPNSFKAGWVAEILKHGFKVDAHIVQTSKIQKSYDWLDSQPFRAPPVMIVNYEAVRRNHILDLIQEFTHGRHAMLVADESIALKNPRAQQSMALRGIGHYFRFIRILTGKPLTQGPHDLWAQLVLIGAEKRRNFYAFRNTFCRMGGWQGKQVLGPQNADMLAQEMKPHVFQAKKQDWLAGLPDKSYTVRDYELTGALRQHYASMWHDFVVWLGNNKHVAAEIVLTKYLKVQQIMCGFIHDENRAPMALVANKDNPRLQLLLATLEETSGKVCVVFRHRYVGDQLAAALRNEGYGTREITGGMKPEEIEEVKYSFNEDPLCRIILLQVNASKFGHTLLGNQMHADDFCSTMIFYENSWSLDDRSQIEDRIHRIGQRNACLYVDFAGTEMDGLIIGALQHKENVYRTIMTLAEKPDAQQREASRRPARSGPGRPGREGNQARIS